MDEPVAIRLPGGDVWSPSDASPPTGLPTTLHDGLAQSKNTITALLEIHGKDKLLNANPLLKRSIRNRFTYLDPINHLQVELLRRHRAGHTDERTQRAIHLTINGVAAGLRNSG